jgi:transcriptional regulator with XRE-family HTH domain
MIKITPEQALRVTIAENVRLERTRRGWSQEQLAEKSGLHRNYVGAIERAEVNFGIDYLARLASAFQIPSYAMLQELRRG